MLIILLTLAESVLALAPLVTEAKDVEGKSAATNVAVQAELNGTISTAEEVQARVHAVVKKVLQIIGR